jgi:PAS domain S-box-containing protein
MSSEANVRPQVMRPWIGSALVAVIRTAERVGMLDALDEPASASSLAEQLGLPERATDLTLQVLRALGYLEQAGDTYRRPVGYEDMSEPWPELEAFVRSGQVPSDIDEPERRGAYYAKSVMGLATMFEHDARQLAEHLGPAERIIDVGAGSAVWSLAMAARSEASVVAIDRPEVVPAAQQMAANLGLEGRFQAIAGDYFAVELDEPVDRIVMANVLHLENEANAARLIERYAQALSADGELVIVDFIGGESFEQQLFTAAYDLHLGMRTTEGRAHRLDVLQRWCSQAGLASHAVVQVGPHGLGALVSSRSGVRTQPRETTSVAVEDLKALVAEREVYEARFRTVFEGAADAIMVVDKRGESIMRTNTAFRELLGVDWSALELQDLEQIVAPGDRERFRELLLGLASGEITERRHRVSMLRDGVPFSAEIAAYDPLARSVILLVVRDHDRLARHEKLRALGELVGGLNHDLNTPLGSLMSNCTLTQSVVGRLASSSEVDARHIDALDTATGDALRAVANIAAKLEAIQAFATLEGAALQALSPHFKSGLAHAICERAAQDADPKRR